MPKNIAIKIRRMLVSLASNNFAATKIGENCLNGSNSSCGWWVWELNVKIEKIEIQLQILGWNFGALCVQPFQREVLMCSRLYWIIYVPGTHNLVKQKVFRVERTLGLTKTYFSVLFLPTRNWLILVPTSPLKMAYFCPTLVWGDFPCKVETKLLPVL